MLIKKILIGVSVAGVIGSGITIYSLYTQNQKIKADRETMKQHYETQIEVLKHPKEKTDEQKEVIKIVYKDKKGDPVVVEKVITKTITEKEPVLLEHPKSSFTSRKYYVSGTIGTTFGSKELSYGTGVGYNFSEIFSSGVRYDKAGKGHRIALEMRINF